MDETIIKNILNSLKEGRTSVLATLIKRSGSAPRDTGTRILVLDDGAFHGTIGGGLFEAQVLEKAGRVLMAGTPERFDFSLAGTDVADSDMICGGEGSVFLEPVIPEDPRRALSFEGALHALEKGERGLLATALDPERWKGGGAPKLFLRNDGEVQGSLLGGRETPAALIDSLSRFQKLKQIRIEFLEDEKGAPFEVLLEPIVPEPFLFVFGGGHVAAQLVSLGARVGFKVVVVDDREEFTNAGRFPEAHEIILAPFEGVMERLSVNAASYLVIVTRGHTHDMGVLHQALETGAKYIGMIGSSQKIRMIYDRLQEDGVSEERLAQVHAPIGLDIGAETPEEIAVSIVAELILARAGGGKRRSA